MPKRLAASLVVLLVAISTSSALRSLQQNGAASVSAAQEPAVPVTSNIQLNAPGRSDLINAPALAPSSAPLPAGVVSLAAQRNSNSASVTDLQSPQQTFDTTTVPVRLFSRTCRGMLLVHGSLCSRQCMLNCVPLDNLRCIALRAHADDRAPTPQDPLALASTLLRSTVHRRHTMHGHATGLW